MNPYAASLSNGDSKPGPGGELETSLMPAAIGRRKGSVSGARLCFGVGAMPTEAPFSIGGAFGKCGAFVCIDLPYVAGGAGIAINDFA